MKPLSRKTTKEHAGATATLGRRIFSEMFILLNFFTLTAAMTWPWVVRLRDAVSDEGDPYMIAWTLWWDYHQTFTDPLHLFHANVFYPYKYTLAFSEHEYGIALLFFPLFALGLRALTVQSVATFCSFAFSGYGAFRLSRTLTRSNGAAWIAGIIFAFVPYRFHALSHLHYIFAGWIPLLLEALVLFARERTWQRASWLGVAFMMNALTCATYFILTLVPLILSAVFLVLHYRIERDRAFWLRGATALGLASLVLLPFMLPYYFVMKLYGFVRSVDDVAVNSPTPMHWLVAEDRNRLWKGLGRGVPDSYKYKLFPGLLPLLLALPAFLWPTNERDATVRSPNVTRKRLLVTVDVAAFAAVVVALIAAGHQASPARLFGVEIFKVITTARALFVLLVVVLVRMCLAYPSALRWAKEKNLIDSLRTARRGDTFALSLIWIVCGFLGSLGMNFFVNRILFDVVPLFRAIRVPTHWAMITYIGLAVLAGFGAQRLVERFREWRPNARPLVINLAFVVIAVALLFELRVAPLRLVRGKVDPDEITLRLKQTTMRGGLVELPHDLGLGLPHLYMLRAADHQKPLVNATSSFISPLSWDIQVAIEQSPIPAKFVDLLESIPASYLVIHNFAIPPERRVDYETFLVRGVQSGRLRFIRSFGERDDLYAVVKTEPQAEREAPLPFALAIKDWGELVRNDPANILGQYRSWSQEVYRFYVASSGRMPRYSEFLPDIKAISPGIIIAMPEGQAKLEERIRHFAESWVERADFRARYKDTGAEAYIDALTSNAGVTLDAAERADMIDKLKRGAMTRAEVLLDIVNNEAFVEKENTRSLVLLHYFGYFQRNPDDPPDNDLTGFNFWIKEVEKTGEPPRLSRAFTASIEYKEKSQNRLR
jgi:hypothetical protein